MTEEQRLDDLDARQRYIRALVDRAPPLSPEQRHRVAALLRPVAARVSSDKQARRASKSA